MITIIGEHGSPTRLVAAMRVSPHVIVHHPLRARRPDWEAARAEAAEKWPDEHIVVVALGESLEPPSPRKGKQ